METKAIARYIRMSPQKVRLVADTIRGKKVEEALATLEHTTKAAARVVSKVVKSAAANVEHNLKAENSEEFRVAVITVDSGPMLKRFRPRAMGRAAKIWKRTSHITVVLRDGV
jgi:large subunit ribosomal protein L22